MLYGVLLLARVPAAAPNSSSIIARAAADRSTSSTVCRRKGALSAAAVASAAVGSVVAAVLLLVVFVQGVGSLIGAAATPLLVAPLTVLVTPADSSSSASSKLSDTGVSFASSFAACGSSTATVLLVGGLLLRSTVKVRPAAGGLDPYQPPKNCGRDPSVKPCLRGKAACL